MKPNSSFPPILLIGIIAMLMISCQPKEATQEAEEPETPTQSPMQIAHLSQGDTEGFQAIKGAFKSNNPGYDLAYFPQVKAIAAADGPRLAFLQSGGGTAVLEEESSKVSVGDILYLPPGKPLEMDSLLDFLVFSIPEALPDTIPNFIRPDWDENITDTPGGCATETNAYRRILLTWDGKNGKYLYHALNAHRVRIMNSFTHYHPKEGGFDEFYLVQKLR